MKCCIKSCKKSSLEKDLFTAPKDPELLKKWQKAVGIKENETDFCVCENHFLSEHKFTTTILNDDAVPTLHLTKEDEIKLQGNCCGICLEKSLERSNLECRTLFKDITGYNVNIINETIDFITN